jgi:hypothetical protein
MPQEAADMTAIVLPDIDRSTIEELKKRIPDLSEIELPNLPSRKEVSRSARDVSKDVAKTYKDVSKNADDAIDRLLGRKKSSMWPWIAAGIGLVALTGIVAAWFGWFRRPAWSAPAEPWSATAYETQTTITTPTDAPSDEPTGTGSSTTDSPGSAPYSTEEA